MIDLFGLGKKPENPEHEGEGANAAPPAEAPVSHGSHRLWAFLLVLDSAFVIVFAGTVAAKVYQHWRAPAPVAAAPRRPAPKPAPKPEPAPEEPKPEAAAKPEPTPAPKAEAPKPAPDAPRPPKPSLLAEAPKPRETPALAPAKPAPAPKPDAPAPSAPIDPAARPKASPVEFKIRSPKAKSVQLVGAFIVRGGRKEMSRDGEGVWSVTVYLHPGSYRYFFSVDKKKVLDPENPQTDRGASVLSVP